MTYWEDYYLLLTTEIGTRLPGNVSDKRVNDDDGRRLRAGVFFLYIYMYENISTIYVLNEHIALAKLLYCISIYIFCSKFGFILEKVGATTWTTVFLKKIILISQKANTYYC